MPGRGKNQAWYTPQTVPIVVIRSHTVVLQYTTDFDTTSRLKSVTQERDLEAFLNAAQLAGTEFTAGTVSHLFFRDSSSGLRCRTSQRQNHPIDIHSESLPSH